MTAAANLSLQGGRVERPTGSQAGAAGPLAPLFRPSRDRGKIASNGLGGSPVRRAAPYVLPQQRMRVPPRHEALLTSHGQLQVGAKLLNMPPETPIMIPLSVEARAPRGLLHARNDWPQMVLANRSGMTLSDLYSMQCDLNGRFRSPQQLRTEVQQFIAAFPQAGFAIHPNAEDPEVSFQAPAYAPPAIPPDLMQSRPAHKTAP